MEKYLKDILNLKTKEDKMLLS